MYSILPFIFILLSLAVIVIVIVRKFPQLTLLDVESIPEVKISKKKDEFLKKKAEKQASVSAQKQKEMFRPVFEKLKEFQAWFRKIVLQVYRKTLDNAEAIKKRKKRTIISGVQKSTENDMNRVNNVKILLDEGDRAIKDGELETAENKFIGAIRINDKSVDAYFGLATVYIKKGEWGEARDTLDFLLKIDPNNVRALLASAEVCEKNDDLEKAVEYYERAAIADDGRAETFAKVGDLLLDINQCDSALEAMRQASELEPENQGYLDKVVEISVKCGNKEVAEEYYQKLRMLDPDNSRLTVLRGKIDQV